MNYHSSPSTHDNFIPKIKKKLNSGHWISPSVQIPPSKRIDFEACMNFRKRFFRYGAFRHLTREELESEGNYNHNLLSVPTFCYFK